MDIVLITLGVVVLAALVALAIRALVRVVPHGERLVIYRLGRFHRVVGPGLVLVLPKLENIVRTFRVRDQPIEVTVGGLFLYGLPAEMTLNLWCSFDLAQAAGGDYAKLANFVQFSDGERRRQVEVKVREALVRQIADLQKHRPLPDTAPILEKVKALAPGSPRYNELLEAAKRDLGQILPTVGAVLNTAQPVTLVRRTIPDEMIEAFSRSRSRTIDSDWLLNYVDQLRERFPDLSNTMLVQILASIEGVDVGRVQRLLLEHDAGTEAEVEYEMSGDRGQPNVITKPKVKEREAATERQPAPPEVGREPPQRCHSL
jgi:hypothetical protein